MVAKVNQVGTAALKNLKVIDLCRSYPPAMAAMVLSDFGGEVLKIDPPGFVFPMPNKGDPETFSAYYFIDRNKRSLSLNLKTGEGLKVFYKLASQADVIIENSKPGTMESLGIGYSTIKDMNPRIIYCSVSGYGQSGPYSRLPGHDSNYLSIAGALSLIGERDRPPVNPSNIIADMASAAMHSLIGILLALLARMNTGTGQYVDISYTDGVFSLLAMQSAFYFLTGELPRRGRHVLTGSEPFVYNYQTKDDGYFSIACIEPWLWENLCQALGCKEFIPHQWTNDQNKKEEIFAFFRKIFLTKTRDEWWEWSKNKNIAAAPVLNLDEAFGDPQIVHRGMMFEREHPILGPVKQVGSPFKLSETPPQFTRFSPMPGEHTEEVLRELGYNEQEIDELREKGVI
jgi:crotonobetainyl-CoA:carnitine CoA-transferase CaiB-like acyl-CoA transferase